MSLHYLLDGYNILHQIPKLTHLEIDQQRLFLVREIEKQRPHGSSRNQITLFFDGRPGRAQPIQSTVVKISFTLDASADDHIKNMVRNAQNSKNYIVVTDDREIQYSIRADGAKVLAVKEFLQRLKENSPSTGKSDMSRGISKGREDEINAELKKIWLNKKKK